MIQIVRICTFLSLVASLVSSQGLHALNRRAAALTNPFLSIEPSDTLKWTPCFKKSPTSRIGGVSCARLVAPLDYSKPSRGHVELAVVRLSGSGEGDAVFYNPGGPGDDPLDDILDNAPLLRTYIGNQLDIIGITPRGVGSTFPPITCDSTNLIASQRQWEIDNTLPGYTPSSLSKSYVIGQSIGLDCALEKPGLVPYVGTVSVAQDMEFVRRALGQQYLNYLGFSYGTALGGTYAALFPDRVGRFVLDGVLDLNDYYSPVKNPSLDIGDADLALEYFFQSCHDAGAKSCPIWSKDIDSIRKRFYKADQQIHESPLPVAGYSIVNWPLWRTGAYNALYRPAEGFPLLAGVTAEILSGSAGPYITAYAQLIQASSTSHAPIDPDTGLRNSPNVYALISCSDSGAPSKLLNPKQLQDVYSRYQDVSSFFGGISSQYYLICAGANLTSKTKPEDTFSNIETANPILFVGNTADPTTPIRNAHRMSQVFSGSEVLTIGGVGHISYNAARDTACGSKWIAPYFQDGTLPPAGTVCDGKQEPFISTGNN